MLQTFSELYTKGGNYFYNKIRKYEKIQSILYIWNQLKGQKKTRA